MTITDWIVAAAMAAAFVYSVTATIKLFKNTRKPRPSATKVAVMDAAIRPAHRALHGTVFPEVDPESQFIWERLRFLEDNSCCESMRYMMEQFESARVVTLSIDDTKVKTIPIIYCPKCGRKL